MTAEIHKFFSPLFNKTAAPEWKAGATAHLVKRFEWLNKRLEGQEYLLGSRFTVADAYLFTTLNWTGAVGIDLAKWPVLKQYHARVASRPKVQEAMQAEGLTK